MVWAGAPISYYQCQVDHAQGVQGLDGSILHGGEGLGVRRGRMVSRVERGLSDDDIATYLHLLQKANLTQTIFKTDGGKVIIWNSLSHDVNKPLFFLKIIFHLILPYSSLAPLTI